MAWTELLHGWRKLAVALALCVAGLGISASSEARTAVEPMRVAAALVSLQLDAHPQASSPGTSHSDERRGTTDSQGDLESDELEAGDSDVPPFHWPQPSFEPALASMAELGNVEDRRFPAVASPILQTGRPRGPPTTL